MHTKKEKGELFLQEPPDGPFDHKALQWHSSTAYVPYHRVKDFIQGEENRKGFPTKFLRCQKHENAQGILKRRVDGEVYQEKICYHCVYGPDLSVLKKKKGDYKGDGDDGEQKDPAQESSAKCEEKDGRHSSKKKSSKKRGCLCSFEVRKLYLQPSVARLTYECFDHVNPDGVICHGTVDSGPDNESCQKPGPSPERMHSSEQSPEPEPPEPEAQPVAPREPEREPERERESVAVPVAAPVQAEVVVQSNPVPGAHLQMYEDVFRIESNVKKMLCNHPSLVVDYCSLLEELEVKLKNILTTKQNLARMMPQAVNPVDTGLALNVMEAAEDSRSVKPMQIPLAPPIRFTSSGFGVDWLKVVDSKQSVDHIPPAPAPKNGTDPRYDWKKILSGRQNPTSIYIPPAPPMKGIPGGFDWEKALAENRLSPFGQQSPSSLGNGNAGFNFGPKQPLGKNKTSSVIDIPPAPNFKANLFFGMNGKQVLDGSQRMVRKAVENNSHNSYGAPFKRHKPSIPFKFQDEGVAPVFMQQNSLPRITAYPKDKIPIVRSPSDVEEQMDTSEDTSSA